MSERPRYRVHTEIGRDFVVVAVQQWIIYLEGKGFWQTELDLGHGLNTRNRCEWEVKPPGWLARRFGDTFAKRIKRAQAQARQWIAKADAAWDRAEKGLAEAEMAGRGSR